MRTSHDVQSGTTSAKKGAGREGGGVGTAGSATARCVRRSTDRHRWPTGVGVSRPWKERVRHAHEVASADFPHADFWVAVAAAAPVIGLGYLAVFGYTARRLFEIREAQAWRGKAKNLGLTALWIYAAGVVAAGFHFSTDALNHALRSLTDGRDSEDTSDAIINLSNSLWFLFATTFGAGALTGFGKRRRTEHGDRGKEYGQ